MVLLVFLCVDCERDLECLRKPRVCRCFNIVYDYSQDISVVKIFLCRENDKREGEDGSSYLNVYQKCVAVHYDKIS